ncbi:unnamed protein product, partial [Mesorhabditis belari]|uniref:Uncharacterized protein n=1 Tax=Mesorhabditis belari TaxID=2138241 RepID=A0AAF3F8A1_9BILA
MISTKNIKLPCQASKRSQSRLSAKPARREYIGDNERKNKERRTAIEATMKMSLRERLLPERSDVKIQCYKRLNLLD